MNRLIVLIIISFIPTAIFAQTFVTVNGILRDTSFSLHGSFLKEQKHRPYIKEALPEMPLNVKSYENIVYSEPTPGRELLVNIYRPTDDKKHPALLMVHGGGWSAGDLSMEIPMAQQIASRGFVTIPVEYRLSPEAVYPAAVHDLKNAVGWVRANSEKYGIDTTFIAISGCSAGGQLAALIGITNGQEEYDDEKENIKYSTSVHAVINIDGTTDLTKSEQSVKKEVWAESKYAPAAVRWLGTIEDNRENWIAASSVNHVTSQSASICFINSSIPRFHDGREETIEKLKQYKIYYEIHELGDTPHPFWLFEPWFDTTVNYMVEYLERVK